MKQKRMKETPNKQKRKTKQKKKRKKPCLIVGCITYMKQDLFFTLPSIKVHKHTHPSDILQPEGDL